ncbi:MAG TPA: HAMP domain-containing sensor histidine kinase [Kofleriaceae bacterium]|nr:HAMP domain-containing sensor histidine kinase [Kofleriaceae bacterium]
MSDDSDELRAEVRRLRDELQRQETFLAIVAHELRNPVGPVLLSIDALLLELTTKTLDPDALLRRLQATRRHAQRLRSDLDRLLDFSRLRSGRIDLQPQETDLSNLIDAVVDDMMPLIAAARCELQTTLQRPLSGIWDPMRLQQVISNLISNAVKYAAGSAIEIVTRADDRTATLVVADHGPGIAERERDTVFRKFERLQGVQQHTGFGIGLWLVRNVIEAMGGSIQLDSAPGHGATFTITLPREAR